MKYFENVETLEELKKEYKKQVLKLHPDLNMEKDTTKEFQEMQNEYERIFEKVKNIRRNENGEKYEKQTDEKFNEFRDIIEKIIHFKEVKIEIIGNWIWLTGNTKTYKDEIKQLNFRWSQNKCAWYYHKDKYHKRSKNLMSMEDIRQKFGVQKVENKYNYELSEVV